MNMFVLHAVKEVSFHNIFRKLELDSHQLNHQNELNKIMTNEVEIQKNNSVSSIVSQVKIIQPVQDMLVDNLNYESHKTESHHNYEDNIDYTDVNDIQESCEFPKKLLTMIHQVHRRLFGIDMPDKAPYFIENFTRTIIVKPKRPKITEFSPHETESAPKTTALSQSITRLSQHIVKCSMSLPVLPPMEIDTHSEMETSHSEVDTDDLPYSITEIWRNFHNSVTTTIKKASDTKYKIKFKKKQFSSSEIIHTEDSLPNSSSIDNEIIHTEDSLQNRSSIDNESMSPERIPLFSIDFQNSSEECVNLDFQNPSEESMNLDDSKSSSQSDEHSPNRIYHCNLCPYYTKFNERYKKHRIAHFRKTKICDICQRAFERPRDLIRHKEKLHKNVMLYQVADNSTRTHVEILPRPHVEVHTIPQVEVHTRTQVEVNTRPQLEVHTRPQLEVHKRPHVDIHTRPHVEIHTRPHVEIQNNKSNTVSLDKTKDVITIESYDGSIVTGTEQVACEYFGDNIIELDFISNVISNSTKEQTMLRKRKCRSSYNSETDSETESKKVDDINVQKKAKSNNTEKKLDASQPAPKENEYPVISSDISNNISNNEVRDENHAIEDEEMIEMNTFDGDSYHCIKCNYFSNSRHKFIQHMTAHKGKFICSRCKKAFTNTYDLKRHLHTHKLDKFSYFFKDPSKYHSITKNRPKYSNISRRSKTPSNEDRSGTTLSWSQDSDNNSENKCNSLDKKELSNENDTSQCHKNCFENDLLPCNANCHKNDTLNGKENNINKDTFNCDDNTIDSLDCRPASPLHNCDLSKNVSDVIDSSHCKKLSTDKKALHNYEVIVDESLQCGEKALEINSLCQNKVSDEMDTVHCKQQSSDTNSVCNIEMSREADLLHCKELATETNSSLCNEVSNENDSLHCKELSSENNFSLYNEVSNEIDSLHSKKLPSENNSSHSNEDSNKIDSPHFKDLSQENDFLNCNEVSNNIDSLVCDVSIHSFQSDEKSNSSPPDIAQHRNDLSDNDSHSNKEKDVAPSAFYCSKCKLNFKNSALLDHHLNFFHSGSTSYTCKICKKEFMDHNKFMIHIRNESCMRHKLSKQYKCTYCTKKFTTMTYLLDHLKIHKQELPTCCDNCNELLPSSKEYEKHLKYDCGKSPNNLLQTSNDTKYLLNVQFYS